MTQDIERLEHLTAPTPEEQINPLVQSKRDSRRRQAKELKEKADDKKRKNGKKKTADRLMLSDPELQDGNTDEHAERVDEYAKEDSKAENVPPPDDDEELNKDTSDGHVDLKA
jgi:hypothetical protein